MRSLGLGLTVLILAAGAAIAQSPAPESPALPGIAPDAAAGDSSKGNANPCRDEVSNALQKLRKTSWFRMNTNMITENGPMKMEIDYVLPDKMHQRVTQTLTSQTSEVVLIGDKAWANEGKGWQTLSNELTQQLKSQMYENVVEQQADIGNYSCKGKATIEGREVMAYKLEGEVAKDSTAPKNEAFRMFYVDAVTGMPLSNALLAPGREAAPLFKATYAYPVDMKIEAPKDVVEGAPAPAKEPGK
jgi:hypothetical protein